MGGRGRSGSKEYKSKMQRDILDRLSTAILVIDEYKKGDKSRTYKVTKDYATKFDSNEISVLKEISNTFYYSYYKGSMREELEIANGKKVRTKVNSFDGIIIDHRRAGTEPGAMWVEYHGSKVGGKIVPRKYLHVSKRHMKKGITHVERMNGGKSVKRFIQGADHETYKQHLRKKKEGK